MSILSTISYKRRNTTAKSKKLKFNTPISDKFGKETPMNSTKLTFASPISQNLQPALTTERWVDQLTDQHRLKHPFKTTLVFRYCEPSSETFLIYKYCNQQKNVSWERGKHQVNLHYFPSQKTRKLTRKLHIHFK